MPKETGRESLVLFANFSNKIKVVKRIAICPLAMLVPCGQAWPRNVSILSPLVHEMSPPLRVDFGPS